MIDTLLKIRFKTSSLLLTIALSVSVLLFSSLGVVMLEKNTSALSGSDFNPGRIIDDVVFYNANSMSADQIQAFLNSKVPHCDTQGTGIANEWGSSKTRAAFAASQGWHGPPYTCLKDFRQNTPQMAAASGLCAAISAGNRTAAQVIQSVAQACNINPQVLIVLLEKEQSLVTDIWPLDRQYRNATGFACPDTAPCNPQYNGFFYQVYHAARQFKVYQAQPNNYNYIAGRSNRIYWHPDLSRCGSSNVYIENQATAALYIYTPYRPNQAALNNLRGTGDSCSSYGNRNFWRLFNDWFGSTQELYRYSFETLVGPNNSVIKTSINTDKTESVTVGDQMYTFYNNKTAGTIEYVVYKNNTWTRQVIDGPGSTLNGSSRSQVSVESILAFEYLGQPQLFYIDSITKNVRHGFMSNGAFHLETLDGIAGSVIKSNRQLGSAIDGFNFGNGHIQLYYYDVGGNNLIHTWWNGYQWGSETLDGTAGGVIKSNRQLGSAISAFDFGNGQIQLYYYDTTNNNLVHTWWNGQKWGSETLDGNSGSVIKSNRQLGTAISGFNFGNGQIQLYYYDVGNGELIHSWFNNGWHSEIMDGRSNALLGNTINSGKRINTAMINGQIVLLYYDDATGFSNGRTSAWRIAYTSGSWIQNVLDGGNSGSKSKSALNIPMSEPSITTYKGSVQLFYADSSGQLRHAWMNK